MKALLLAAFIITIGLASCSITQPGERTYYPQQRAYNSSIYRQDPYYNPDYDNRYTIRRVYDYNTGRYYDVPVYSSPVYSDQVYANRTYRRDNYRRDNNVRREYYNQAQSRNEQPRVEQPREKRLPDGTRVSPDGTITLPNGEVRRSNK